MDLHGNAAIRLVETQVAGQICPIVWSEMLETMTVTLDGSQNVCGAIAPVLSVRALKAHREMSPSLKGVREGQRLSRGGVCSICFPGLGSRTIIRSLSIMQMVGIWSGRGNPYLYLSASR